MSDGPLRTVVASPGALTAAALLAAVPTLLGFFAVGSVVDPPAPLFVGVYLLVVLATASWLGRFV